MTKDNWASVRALERLTLHARLTFLSSLVQIPGIAWRMLNNLRAKGHKWELTLYRSYFRFSGSLVMEAQRLRCNCNSE